MANPIDNTSNYPVNFEDDLINNWPSSNSGDPFTVTLSQRIRNSIIAIEKELGTSPSDSYLTVNHRLFGIEESLLSIPSTELDSFMIGASEQWSSFDSPGYISLYFGPLQTFAPNIGKRASIRLLANDSGQKFIFSHNILMEDNMTITGDGSELFNIPQLAITDLVSNLASISGTNSNIFHVNLDGLTETTAVLRLHSGSFYSDIDYSDEFEVLSINANNGVSFGGIFPITFIPNTGTINAKYFAGSGLYLTDIVRGYCSSLFNATTDWGSPSSGLYSQSFAHNLGTKKLIVQLWNDSSELVVAHRVFIETNSVTISVPQTPDTRFSGNIVVAAIV